MQQNQIPTHIAIIMDGNGRWAKQRGKDRVYGHFEGVESVRAVMEAAVEWGIPYISFFAFSEENWGRPADEVNTLMDLMGRAMLREMDNFMEHDIRFLVLGNLERLSEGLRAGIDSAMAQTAGNKGMTMILFLSYSGQWDIRQAARRMAAAGADDLAPYLVTAGIPDPDLIIRTSGEQRISNFLLWQAAYAEFVFSATLWPDFRKESLRDALLEYASRDRRFGKVK